jgi:hypothetical protein
MKIKERHIRAESIIDHYSIGETFSDKHLKEFEQLTGVSFEWIRRVRQPRYAEARHLECCCPEWDHTGSFSWQKAIRQLSDDKYEDIIITETMREALRFYQKDWLSKQLKICTFCGSTDNPQADHKDTPFLEIQKSFIEKSGKPVLLKDETVGWKLENEQLWLEHHNKLANYQVLCRSCNASKGAK